MRPVYRKWKVFVDEYLRLNMNGTRAYKAVYGGHLDDNVAATSAIKILRKPQIEALIQERLSEHHMGAEEVLARLADQARNVAADYFDEDGNFDFEKAKADGKLFLVKSVSKTDGDKSSSFKVELYDAQTALNLIGKHLKLFTSEESPVNVNVRVQNFPDLVKKIYDDNDPDHPGA